MHKWEYKLVLFSSSVGLRLILFSSHTNWVTLSDISVNLWKIRVLQHQLVRMYERYEGKKDMKPKNMQIPDRHSPAPLLGTAVQLLVDTNV